MNVEEAFELVEIVGWFMIKFLPGAPDFWGPLN